MIKKNIIRIKDVISNLLVFNASNKKMIFCLVGVIFIILGFLFFQGVVFWNFKQENDDFISLKGEYQRLTIKSQ